MLSDPETGKTSLRPAESHEIVEGHIRENDLRSPPDMRGESERECLWSSSNLPMIPIRPRRSLESSSLRQVMPSVRSDGAPRSPAIRCGWSRGVLFHRAIVHMGRPSPSTGPGGCHLESRDRSDLRRPHAGRSARPSPKRPAGDPAAPIAPTRPVAAPPVVGREDLQLRRSRREVRNGAAPRQRPPEALHQLQAVYLPSPSDPDAHATPHLATPRLLTCSPEWRPTPGDASCSPSRRRSASGDCRHQPPFCRIRYARRIFLVPQPGIDLDPRGIPFAVDREDFPTP
jgi:hypothetical protein